jgi:steroid 5-alpha reductase family enzyme
MVVVDNGSNADELDPLRVASSLALISLWWSASRTTLSSQLTALWSLSTLALAWFVALSKIERNDLIHLPQRHLLPLAIRG